MEANSQGLSVTDPRVETVSQFFRRVGTGFRVMSHEKRSMIAKTTNKAKWELRRQRYGPTGMRDKPYTEWLKAHGKVSPATDSESSQG